ncbi:unnamed protein product [Psylliodes chrysocephalus]|uniref:Uncharacterized protein n=1 Tax=Psylliodes chrysocephalus TaxID=3402493 RepID=A0A9P0D997_9CUCU|nr:unnamed protein product [Psylliodes chrysocephala]
MSSDEFTEFLNAREEQAWTSLKAVVNGFLDNNRADNFKESVGIMLEIFKIMGCRMSHKLHMLHSLLDQFKNNMDAYLEKQEERFYQDVMYFEQRYQEQYNENMTEDYIWGLMRESPYKHKRTSKNCHF